MNWFKPAWEQLTEEERYVLKPLHGRESAALTISEELNIEAAPITKEPRWITLRCCLRESIMSKIVDNLSCGF